MPKVNTNLFVNGGLLCSAREGRRGSESYMLQAEEAKVGRVR